MKIFVDSANINEIKTAMNWRLCDGVTTNPSTLGQLGVDPNKVVSKICSLVKGPISFEVTSRTHKEMVQEGKKISRLAKNIVVKVPVTRDGLMAIDDLAKFKITINATNLFTPVQALLAARFGASYVSTWIGRSDDIYMDGLKLVADSRKIFDVYKIKTKILACSIKNINQVVDVAKLGADISTVPFDVIEKMTTHPMTDLTLKLFLDDWKNIPKKLRQ